MNLTAEECKRYEALRRVWADQKKAREETDIDGDTRLVDAMKQLATVPAFSIGDEIAKYNAGARIADDHFCKGCGARGYVYKCENCERG